MGTRLSTPLAALLGAVLAGGLIAGCGGARNTGEPATPGGSVSTSPSPSEGGPGPGAGSTPPAPTTRPPLTATSIPPAGDTWLTGVVEEGVERGCLIMRTGGKVYLLMGGDRSVVKSGAKVKVRGRLDSGMISYCQQGEPFQVLEAHPAG
jgi:hypothetical protein